MLEKYENILPRAYHIMKKNIIEDKLAHAYLFENKNVSNLDDFIKAIAIEMFCSDVNKKGHDINNCSVCQAIINNNYTEIKYIYAEGNNIKKEQMLSLQSQFAKKSLLGKKRLYVIYGAEKLNESSSNAILKFLEEPSEGIIAILVTNNSKNLLDTIVSRCRVVKLFEVGQASLEIKNYLGGENYSLENIDDVIKDVMNFINNYEENGIKTLLFVQKLWHQKFDSKELVSISIELLLLIYVDILNFKLGKNEVLFKDYIDDIKKLAYKNDTNILIKKISAITEIKKRKKYNINSNLLIDKLILMLEGGN